MTDDVEQRARDLIVFCDGLEHAGFADFSQRARMVARDLLKAIHDLRMEQSARVSIQAERDRLRDMLSAKAVR